MDQLPMLALLYNEVPHSQTYMSPYLVTTGSQALLPMDLVLCNLKVPATEDFLRDIK